MKSLIAILVICTSIYCSNAAACDVTLTPTNDIQTALNTTGVNTVCLSAGQYNVSASITIPSSKSLIGVGDSSLIASTANRIILLSNSATLGNLAVHGSGSNEYAILGDSVSGATVWSTLIRYASIPIGLNGASSIQLLNNRV